MSDWDPDRHDGSVEWMIVGVAAHHRDHAGDGRPLRGVEYRPQARVRCLRSARDATYSAARTLPACQTAGTTGGTNSSHRPALMNEQPPEAFTRKDRRDRGNN
jgi:hypothetical protein